MKKAILLFLTLLLFLSCTFLHPFLNPYRAYQNDFENILNSDDLKSTSTLSYLFNYKNVTWDELVFYGPYSYTSENVKTDLGLSVPYLGDSYNDGDWVLLFVNKTDNSYSLKYFLFGSSYEVSQDIFASDTHYTTDDLYEVINQNNQKRLQLKHK